MKKKYAALVTGYVSMDHIINISSPAKVGFTSLIENQSNSTIRYGGCSVNIAYALCKLNMPSVPVIRVGSDYESTGFKEFLEKGNVPPVGIKKIESDSTSISYLLKDNNGDHITIFYPGAMREAYAHEIPDDLFDEAALGVITVGTKKDNLYFARQCISHKLPIVFCMKGDMKAFSREVLLETLNHSKIIFTNECERKTIEEVLDIPDIRKFFDTGICDVIVVTYGKKGSRYYCKNGDTGEVPSFDLFPAKDTTGCGDGYVSGFLYGYLHDKPIKDCCLYGSIVSSYVLAQEGCCTSLPTEQELTDAFTKIGVSHE